MLTYGVAFVPVALFKTWETISDGRQLRAPKPQMTYVCMYTLKEKERKPPLLFDACSIVRRLHTPNDITCKKSFLRCDELRMGQCCGNMIKPVEESLQEHTSFPKWDRTLGIFGYEKKGVG